MLHLHGFASIDNVDAKNQKAPYRLNELFEFEITLLADTHVFRNHLAVSSASETVRVTNRTRKVSLKRYPLEAKMLCAYPNIDFPISPPPEDCYDGFSSSISVPLKRWSLQHIADGNSLGDDFFESSELPFSAHKTKA